MCKMSYALHQLTVFFSIDYHSIVPLQAYKSKALPGGKPWISAKSANHVVRPLHDKSGVNRTQAKSVSPPHPPYSSMCNSIYDLAVIVVLVGLLRLFILVSINNLPVPAVRAERSAVRICSTERPRWEVEHGIKGAQKAWSNLQLHVVCWNTTNSLYLLLAIARQSVPVLW